MIVKTEIEIQAAIGAITERMLEKAINKFCNAPVKQGYKEALHILCNKIETYDDIPKHCTSIQSRAIAVLAVDFLHGECTHDVLCNVPLKRK